MALATQVDVEAALGRVLSASEVDRVEAQLRRASSIVIGYTGQDFEPAPYPETVVDVVADMVARLFRQGDAILPEQQGAGPFTVRYPAAQTSGTVWLAATDKIALRPYRKGGGLTSVQLVGDRYDITPGA